MVSHKGLRELVADTADEYNIPYQYASIAGGGTDSGHSSNRKGVPSLSITVCYTLYSFTCGNSSS